MFGRKAKQFLYFLPHSYRPQHVEQYGVHFFAEGGGFRGELQAGQSGSQIVSYLFLGLHATRNLDLYIYKSNYLFPLF